MKSIASVLSIIVLGVGLLSCSGDGGSSSTAFLYVSNSGGTDISAYRVDTSTGVLTPLAGSPFPSGDNPQGMTLSTTGSLLLAFVSNAGSSTVSSYIVNASTGVLTPASAVGFNTGANPRTLTLEPFERFAFVANTGSSSVSVYLVNTANGILTEVPGSPFSVFPGIQPQQATVVTVSSTKQFVYLANAQSGNVSGFSLNTNSGFLTQVPGSPFTVGSTLQSTPLSVVADSAGNFVYVSNTGEGTVSAFRVDQTNGALIANVPNAPFAAGGGPQPVTLHPSKLFAYVANAGSSNLSAYLVNTVTGVLTPITNPDPVAPDPNFFGAGSIPQQVTIDPSGKFALVANAGSNNVSVYAINQIDGRLAEVTGSPFPSEGLSQRVIVDPTGKFVFVPNAGTHNVSAYQLNSTTGFLTPVAGSPFPAGTSPLFATTAGTF
jgi:6-phosphogluconolactonase (cycloisomerase 2 family)